MAITNCKTDLAYPFVGDVTTIVATLVPAIGSGVVGNRYRCKLTSKPADSGLELFDDARDNYVANNLFTPDVPGRYYFTVREETVSVDVPRFSNDLGGADKTGIEQVPENSAATLTVTIGEVVTREIGIAPDTVTFEAHCHTLQPTVSNLFGNSEVFPLPSSVTDPLTNESGGIVTAYIDRPRSPRLILDGASDPSQIAASSISVAKAMRDLGAIGSPSYQYGARYGENRSIMPWNLVVADPIVEFGWTVQRFNTHVVANAIPLHAGADGNAMVNPSGANLAQWIAFLNELLSRLKIHVQLVAGPVHGAADTLTKGHLDSIAALGAGATFPEVIDRTNLMWWCLDEHLTRIWPAHDSAITAYAVHPAGDVRLDADAYTIAIDAATVADRCSYMRARYEDHRARTGYTLGPYHANVATDAEQYTDALPDNRDSYPVAVGTLYDLLRKHLGNMSAAGVSTAYHTAIDNTLAALRDGKPSSFEDAVRYHETINWILATHAFKGAPVHEASYPVGWRPTVRGIEALHHAFRTELLSAAAVVPPNEVYSSSKLVMLGGFKKG